MLTEERLKRVQELWKGFDYEKNAETAAAIYREPDGKIVVEMIVDVPDRVVEAMRKEIAIEAEQYDWLRTSMAYEQEVAKRLAECAESWAMSLARLRYSFLRSFTKAYSKPSDKFGAKNRFDVVVIS